MFVASVPQANAFFVDPFTSADVADDVVDVVIVVVTFADADAGKGDGSGFPQANGFFATAFASEKAGSAADDDFAAASWREDSGLFQANGFFAVTCAFDDVESGIAILFVILFACAFEVLFACLSILLEGGLSRLINLLP